MLRRWVGLALCVGLGGAWYLLVSLAHGIGLRVGEACVIAVSAAGIGLTLWSSARARALHPRGHKADEQDQEDLASLLGGIDRCSTQIASFDGSELFNTVFKEEVAAIAREMEIAAIKQSMDVSPRGHTTRPLLACMHGSATDICRFVHHLDNNSFFTSPHSRDFFERVFAEVTVEPKRITEVRRLLVSYGEESSQDELTKRLMAFHGNVDGYDWRIIDWALFDALGREEGYLDEHLDFGIYGDHYLYLSNQRPSDRRQVASGTFVAAQAEIKRYTTFFNFVWERLPVPDSNKCEGSCASPEALFAGLSSDGKLNDIASATVELVRDLG
jgi:hypothetical protein